MIVYNKLTTSIVLACIICQVSSQNQYLPNTITLFSNELTQTQLQQGDKSALLWGQTKDRFIKCQNDGQYYDIILGAWTMTKIFNNQLTVPHDGLIITLSFVFVNFDASLVNTQVKFKMMFDDGNSRYMWGTISKQNNGCGSLTTGNDGVGSAISYIPHTSSTLKVYIEAGLSGNQQLGIRDLTIKTVKCSGSNYYFNILFGGCLCKSGYTFLNNDCVKK